MNQTQRSMVWPTHKSKMVKVGLVPTGVPEWDTRGPHMEPENWAPNFPGDKVQVMLITYHMPDGLWKVCVSGADDTMMAAYVATIEEAEWLFNAIGDGITSDALKMFGFQRE